MQRPSRFVLSVLLIAGVAIVAIAIGVVSWQGFMADIRATEDRIQRDHDENLRINNELAHIGDMTKRLVELNAQLRDLDRDMPEYRYIPTYLRQIEAAARNTGNELMSIQPGDPKDLDLAKSPLAPPKATPGMSASGVISDAPPPAPSGPPKPQISGEKVQRIGLDVKGSYKSVLAMLDALRLFPKLIYVRTVSLTPSKNADGTTSLSARLETYAIITPDQNLKPEATKVPAPVGGTP
jgi:Tfp pilus assembly protein PilO